ncbi:MAG: sugar transferase [Arachnia sp.]
MTALERQRAAIFTPAHPVPEAAAAVFGLRHSQWLIATDAVILMVVGVVGLAFRELVYPYPDSAVRMAAITTVHVVVWIIGLHALGLYRRGLRTSAQDLALLIKYSFTLLLGISGVLFITGIEMPNRYLTTLFIAGFCVMAASRIACAQILKALDRNDPRTIRIVIAGSPTHIDEAAAALLRVRGLPLEVIGGLSTTKASATDDGLPILGDPRSIDEVVSTREVQAVIITEGAFSSAMEFRRLAWQLEQSKAMLLTLPNVSEVAPGRVQSTPVGGLPLSRIVAPGASRSLSWCKRAFDVSVSACLLLITFPLMLGVTVAIKLEDGGPVVFRQRRVGLHGRQFWCLKLRSMCVDAEAKKAALTARDEGAGALFKLRHDPRITTVGRLIRRYSIDELPQLWNVLLGDMSLVGPRPALPTEVATYEPDVERRLAVRPGLSGLWQVSGRSNLSWEESVRLDLYYVDNWSMIADIVILARTARAVFGSDGAY